jgi:hypothetical protein
MTHPKFRRPRASQQLRQEQFRVAEEVRRIQHRAFEHDSRIVSIGPLVLFSTRSGDAWMLDPADQLAVRLALDGDPLPVQIEETHSHYAIAWQGCYRIEADAFIYEDNASQRLTAIRGYPLQPLLRTISKVTK